MPFCPEEEMLVWWWRQWEEELSCGERGDEEGRKKRVAGLKKIFYFG